MLASQQIESVIGLIRAKPFTHHATDIYWKRRTCQARVWHKMRQTGPHRARTHMLVRVTHSEQAVCDSQWRLVGGTWNRGLSWGMNGFRCQESLSRLSIANPAKMGEHPRGREELGAWLVPAELGQSHRRGGRETCGNHSGSGFRPPGAMGMA